MQNELRAIKSYAPPMVNLLHQQMVDIPATSSTQGDMEMRSIYIMFLDGESHMVWCTPVSTTTWMGGVDYQDDGYVQWGLERDKSVDTRILVSSFSEFEANA